MADRPILYSAPMIRALLAGTKTQTRRVLKPRAGLTLGELIESGMREGRGYQCTREQVEEPRIKAGDRLWVREAWKAPERLDKVAPRDMGKGTQVYFVADDRLWPIARYRQAMHMPRWASRLTQVVTDVRVQRLHDITEEDAIAEGIERQDPTPEDFEWARAYAEQEGITEADLNMGPVWLAPGTRQGFGPRRDHPKWGGTPEFAYRLLWEHINGPGSWDANPWVCAISLSTIRKNIDQIEVRNGLVD